MQAVGQFNFGVSRYCSQLDKMLLNYTITLLCIVFIEIQANIVRDVVEEKQKLLKREREARKKNILIETY